MIFFENFWEHVGISLAGQGPKQSEVASKTTSEI
jgi:hypothetical protein